jgi:phage host-nuclease inhibitor protein Gam
MSKTDHYKDLVDNLSILLDASNRLTALTTQINQGYLELVDEHREEYAYLQETISKVEVSIEALAILNPQWFAEKKTVTTPYGSVTSRKSSELEVPNEEVSIVLLEQLGAESAAFIRTKKELNLEALEQLSDDELARIRIKRVAEEKITAKPAALDMGKAAKAVEKQRAKAATTTPTPTATTP